MTTPPLLTVYDASTHEYLRHRWLNCLSYLEVDSESKIAHKWFNAIINRYDHHDRLFHDTVRLYDQLMDLSIITDCEKVTKLMAASLSFAMFFQFYEYTPGHAPQVSTCNSEIAGMACYQLGVGIGSTAFIQSCLLGSWDHEVTSYNTALFHDAELSLLGEAPPKYMQYTNDLFLECCDWDDTKWYTARQKWLSRMLTLAAEGRLYYTDTCRRSLETTAISNMRKEFSVNQRRLNTLAAYDDVFEDHPNPELTNPYYEHDYTTGMKLGEHITINGQLHVWDGVELVLKENEFEETPF